MNNNTQNTDLNRKECIQEKYELFISTLNTCIECIGNLSGKNSKFDKIQSSYLKTLNDLVAKSKEQMSEMLEGAVWDKLVIAFFGETNAGKSTIIETFRILFNDNERQQAIIENDGKGVDGQIVGDGRVDFTKVYEEYVMHIDGKPFMLIDVPGIQGKEDDFINDIKKALSQAHLVFFVHGHNIKPDVATASKIKKYLRDWVNVYSIYNVRGGAFNYMTKKKRENLLYGDAVQAEELIKKSFPKILGDVYKGNISLQALLALCSVANFSSARTDLIDTQTKVLRHFGAPEKILSFSHFNDITNLISQKAGNFNEEIVEANKQKLMSLGRFFIDVINSEMDAQASNIEKFSDELRTYDREISIIFADTRNSLKNRLFAKNDMLFSQLQRDINEVIDINRSNSDIEDGIDQLCYTFSSEFKGIMISIVEDEFAHMSDKLKKKQKSLDCYKSLIEDVYPDDIDPNLEIDFSEAFAEMNVSLGGVLSTLGLAAVGAGVGALFGGVGAIPGALIGSGLDLLRKSFFGDGGKDKAKAKVKEELKKAKNNAKSILDGVCDSVNSRLSTETATTSAKIKDDCEGLQVIFKTLSSAKRSLQNSMKDINKAAYGNI